MIKCPFCGTMHIDNTLFCSECGTYLQEEDLRGTDPLGTDELDWLGEADGEASESIEEAGPISIHFKIGQDQRNLDVTLASSILIGRLDPTSDIFPEVDLTPDDGMNKGVSRRHARIVKNEGRMFIEDLGSVNGTFVNGKRLAPYLPEPLNEGDQLQLGQILVQFELHAK